MVQALDQHQVQEALAHAIQVLVHDPHMPGLSDGCVGEVLHLGLASGVALRHQGLAQFVPGVHLQSVDPTAYNFYGKDLPQAAASIASGSWGTSRWPKVERRGGRKAQPTMQGRRHIGICSEEGSFCKGWA